LVHGSDIIHLKDLAGGSAFYSIWRKFRVAAQTCELGSTPTLFFFVFVLFCFPLSYELLCRLELMTGSGRRCKAAEPAEDLQIEEVLTPIENRYLGNSSVIIFIAVCHLMLSGSN
jgi:hypothetical protein